MMETHLVTTKDLTIRMILIQQMVFLVVDDLDGNTVVGNTVAGLWSCLLLLFLILQ